MNKFIFLALIVIAFCLYKYSNTKLELIALVFSPLVTLAIIPMIEESKSKWNTKYETFKYLYANRNNIINYGVVQNLNLIDIVFINDKQVRKRWKELRKLFTSDSSFDQKNAKYAELIAAMANALGLDKDIGYSDIIWAYYPTGLADIESTADKKMSLEIEFYQKACSYMDQNVQK